MDNIKIVRLQSGEDVIADYFEDDGTGQVCLNKPMSIIFKRLKGGKAMMLMNPWLPLEIVEDNKAYLFSGDIMTLMQPKGMIIDYYNNITIESEKEAMEIASEISDFLNEQVEYLDASDVEDAMSLSDEDDFLDDMDDYPVATVTNKKNLLH